MTGININIDKGVKAEDKTIFVLRISGRNLSPTALKPIIGMVKKAIKDANSTIKNFSVLILDESLDLYSVTENDINKLKTDLTRRIKK